MNNTGKTEKELKDEQISQILSLAEELSKGKWYTEKGLKTMNCADRETLLEMLKAEKQFIADFMGGDELILERI